MVFEGGFCEQPPLDLIRAIGRSCYVVDDDLLIGLRWIVEDVPADGDPLGALAEAYLERSSYSPVQHDLRKPKEKMLLRADPRAPAPTRPSSRPPRCASRASRSRWRTPTRSTGPACPTSSASSRRT